MAIFTSKSKSQIKHEISTLVILESFSAFPLLWFAIPHFFTVISLSKSRGVSYISNLDLVLSECRRRCLLLLY